MQNKMRIKIIIDITMSILMVLIMVYQFIGNAWHEYLGIVLVVLVIVHNILNQKFYSSIGKENFSFQRMILSVVDITLLCMMIVNAITAVIVSRYVFAFMNIASSFQIRSIHVFSGWWILFMMAVHIGLHYWIIHGYIEKIFGNKCGSKAIMGFKWILLIITDAVGIIGALENDLFLKLTIHSSYSFYENSNIFWEIYKVIAIVCLIATMSYWVLEAGKKVINERWKSNENSNIK